MGSRRRPSRWPAILAALVMTGCAVAGQIIYVDTDATGANNGSSWADAHNYLQDALADANASAKPVEIRVAQGIYRPDEDTLHPEGTGDREATFQLINGLSLKGGYAGRSQPDPNARDIEKYQTVLSGDLDANDVDLAGAEWEDIDNLIRWGSRKDNSYSVVTGSGTNQTAVLDGFTITAGQADGTDGPWDSPQVNGAGMYNHHGSPSISNCTFLKNTTCGYDRRTHGAGLFNSDSDPVLRNCSFVKNIAFGANGLARGGGLFDVNSAPTLTNCIFRNNIVTGFDSDYYGGAAYEDNSRSTFANCIFVQNSGEGGAMQFCRNLRLANCTFAGNGTAIGCDYWGCGQPQTISLEAVNCIIWDNIGELPVAGWFEIQITYSDVRDGWAGEGNIDADPLFLDAGRGDYRLRRGSPCINAGDNSAVGQGEVDLDGQPRIVNDRVDMGSYEYQGSKIIYVDADATGANDGSSWADAHNYLQDALMRALDGDEIRVAQGVYKPNEGIDWDVPDLRSLTFLLRSGVSVVGGYAGFGSPDPNRRDVENFETILSGDLAGDDVPGFVNHVENSYHVVLGELGQPYPLADTLLDGFTITGGNANGDNWHEKQGGGIFIEIDCALVVRNCTITRNRAEYSGGGMHSIGYGGCASAITSCRFTGNVCTVKGGGISLDGESIPYMTNCLFAGNLAATGGALYDIDSYPRIINCTFSGNRALSECGGVRERGGGVQLRSCILWGNSDSSGSSESAQFQPRYDYWPNTNYCCVQGWTGALGGVGNNGDDPCFGSAGYWDANGTPEDMNDDVWVNGDYHVKSQAGRWDPQGKSWVHDELTSPCIDAGDPLSPIGPEAFPNGGRINMGAYGGTAEASKTYFGGPACEVIVAGDINGDCKVDFRDFTIMAGYWLWEQP